MSGNLYYENVTALGSYNGIIHDVNNSTYSYGLKKFAARNTQYIWDPAYDDGDVLDNVVGPVAHVAVEGAAENSLANISLENLYVDAPGGAAFYVGWDSGQQRSYSPAQITGLLNGTPPGGDYATASNVGLNYCSPYDGVGCADMALVGYWKLNESSGTSAADSAGANTGTAAGSPVWICL